MGASAARVPGPQNDCEDEDYDGDGDDAPGSSGIAVAEEFFFRRMDIFGAGKLQVWEFVELGRGLDSESWFAVGRDGAFFGSGRDRRRGRIPDFVGVHLGLAQASQIVGDGVFVVEAEVLGVGANESFVEDSTGKLVEVLLLDGLEHARADFGDVGNVIERDALGLARLAKFVSEMAHASPM